MIVGSYLHTAHIGRRWSIISAILFYLSFNLIAAVHEEPVPDRSASRELIVRFHPEADPADKARALRNSAKIQPLNLSLPPGRFRAANYRAPVFQRVQIEDGVRLDSELARLEANPAVAFVEPNYPVKIHASTNSVFPNDFEFSKMYGLHNPGGTDARTNADISAPEAWRFTTGNRSVILAVIDTGIDYLHEDLQENIWTNSKEIPANGVDDDGNGLVDDFYGYDFVSNDSDPFDDNQHGTHVAGTIGAKGNNGVGTVGVCWEVSLMALKAFDENGNGTVGDAIAAISYAVQNGAKVINASWGLDERSKALEEASRFAADAGVLIVAAAGNNRTEAPSYPASFETVLSVGATNAKDARADFSNFGSFVDVAAPGAEIMSTLPENKYGFLSGTSMAAPHVSGMAALVLSRFPTYTRQELFDILVNSVDTMVFDQPIGNGRINLSIAVQMDQPLPTAHLFSPATVSGVLDIKGDATGSFFAGYSLNVGAGRTPSNWVSISSGLGRITNGSVGIFDSSVVPDGPAVLQLVVSNQNGATAFANAPVRVFNSLITFPLAGDILPPAKYPVRATVHGPGKTFELSFGVGLNPASWVVIATGGTGLLDAPIAEWDASQLPTGFYSLRLQVATGSDESEFIAPAIYIDRRIKPGWPVYVPTDGDFPTTEWRNVRAADLEGDGISELILVDAGTRNHPQRLLVYKLDGTLLWGTTLGFDIPPDIPVIGDTDGDGKKEIFVDSTNGIVAFKADGTLLEGWPIETATGNHAKVLADVDLDGKLELIAYSQEYAATQVAELRELSIYTSRGALVRKWPLPWCGFTNDLQKIAPAVANLDDHPDLEIVVPSGCSELLALDHDRNTPKWSSAVVGRILSSPVVGDVDGNGIPDVIVAVSSEEEGEPAGLYVFHPDGTRRRGWPVLEEFSFVTAPALGDLDQDGRLEIVLPDEGNPAALHAVQWDGFEADGWPVKMSSKTGIRLGATIANIDGIPGAEVLLGSPGYPGLALGQNDPGYIGGISALDSSGKVLPLNGPSTLASIPFESSGQLRLHKAAPVILGDFDGNGRTDLLLSSIQDRTFGSLSKFKDRSSLYLWELEPSLGDLHWPMLGGDPANRGTYTLPLYPEPTPTNITRAIRDRIITGEDRELRIEALANDWNGTRDPLELISFTLPANGTVLREGNTLIYMPLTNFSGMDTFSYALRDSRGTTNSAAVVLRVKPENDRPVAEPIEITMKKNTSVDVFYNATDAEDDDLTFRIVRAPEHGEIWNYPALGNYYPTRGFSGTDSFAYVANDGRSDSLAATVSITILNSNNPPQAVSQNLLTKTNRSVFVSPGGSDLDGDPLTFELVQQPQVGKVIAEDNGFTFTPGVDFIGEDSFTFRAHDGTTFGEEATVTIGVIATNASPRASNRSVTVQPNVPTNFRLSGSDPDGDKVTFVILTEPIHGIVSGEPPQLTYTPDTNYLGPDRLEFKVTDGLAESAPAAVTIQVMRQNRPPKSEEQVVSTVTQRPVTFALNSIDPDNDPLRAVILKGPAQGLLYGTGTNWTYVPRTFVTGTDWFTYKMWDGQRFGEVVRVLIAISDPVEDRPPTFTNIQLSEENMVKLELTVPPGKPFSVYATTNLQDWFKIEGPIVPLDGTYLLMDTNLTGPSRFYRAIRH